MEKAQFQRNFSHDNEIVAVLQKVLQAHSREFSETKIYLDIEVIIAQHTTLLSMVQNPGFTRVFPVNGSHYIDIYEDYGIDSRVYIVLGQLYKYSLTNYIDKLSVHEGTLRVVIRRGMYTIEEVKQEFERSFDGNISVAGDMWGYEILEAF